MTAIKMLVRVLTCTSIIGAAAFASFGSAQANEEYVSNLRLTNKGAYTINKVFLKWKRPTDNKHYSRNEINLLKKKAGAKFTKTGDSGITNGGIVRIDLERILEKKATKYYPKAGDEVWLVGHIMYGNKKSCRKSKSVIFQPGVKLMRAYSMGGTTLNNNRCKRKELIVMP